MQQTSRLTLVLSHSPRESPTVLPHVGDVCVGCAIEYCTVLLMPALQSSALKAAAGGRYWSCRHPTAHLARYAVLRDFHRFGTRQRHLCSGSRCRDRVSGRRTHLWWSARQTRSMCCHRWEEVGGSQGSPRVLPVLQGGPNLEEQRELDSTFPLCFAESCL